MKTVPEPNAELLTAEDVDTDVAFLNTILARRSAESKAYDILQHPNVRKMLDKLISEGVCANDEEAIEKALETLVTTMSQ
jgi:hypothetical protein